METLHDLVSNLIIDTRGAGDWTRSSLGGFLPELILCATILVMLFVRLFNWGRRIDTFYIALLGGLLALAAPWVLGSPVDLPGQPGGGLERMEIFTGMLIVDGFTVFVRALLILFLVLFAVFTKLSGIPDKEDGPDIYTLVLGATIGMCLMVSANHLLIVFLAVEMASVPSYALAGMLKGRRLSSEAALKYSIYGAGAAGVMLYGISLIAGVLNTVHLPTIAERLLELNVPNIVATGQGVEQVGVLIFGTLMVMVGLAFKLSAVPFHFWCPDVFEGAAAEVGAFLSIASKAAALALLVRVVIGFGADVPNAQRPYTIASTQATAAKGDSPQAAQAAGALHEPPQVAGALRAPSALPNPTDDYLTSYKSSAQESAAATDAEATQETPTDNVDSLWLIRDFLAKLVAFLAIITCTFGNLAAYGQTNIKRLMAYSTIAHAGYMMMPVAALLAMAGYDNAQASKAIGALCIYMFIYLFMNLGAFAIIAFLRNAMRSEEIRHYGGLIRQAPMTAVALSLILFGLIGLPPLAGFIGKFAIFASLMDGYNVAAAHGYSAGYLMGLLVVGGLNTALSLFYYLRIVKVMTIDPTPEDRAPLKFSSPFLEGTFVWVITGATVILFFFWDQINRIALAAAENLLA